MESVCFCHQMNEMIRQCFWMKPNTHSTHETKDAYNPKRWEAEAGGLQWVWGQPRLVSTEGLDYVEASSQKTKPRTGRTLYIAPPGSAAQSLSGKQLQPPSNCPVQCDQLSSWPSPWCPMDTSAEPWMIAAKCNYRTHLLTGRDGYSIWQARGAKKSK